MEFLLEQLTLWSPTVASVIGIVVTSLFTIYKLVKAINDFKERNKEEIKALIDNDSQIKIDLNNIVEENKELKRTISILVDKLTKVDGYVEAKLNEQKNINS